MIGVASLTLALATCFTLLHNLQRISFQNFSELQANQANVFAQPQGAGGQALASGEKISMQDRIEGAEHEAQNGSGISETSRIIMADSSTHQLHVNCRCIFWFLGGRRAMSWLPGLCQRKVA